jgi:hypothetical protein
MDTTTGGQETFQVVLSWAVSLASLGLSWLSIWLALRFKDDAERVNNRTVELLVDVRTDAKSMVSITASELKSWGETGRQIILGSTVTSADSVRIGGASEQAGSAVPHEKGGADAPH